MNRTGPRFGLLLLAAILGLPGLAFGQGAVQQQGAVSAGQIPMYVGNGRVIGSGGAPALGQSPINPNNPGTLPSGIAVANPGLGFAAYSGYANGPYASFRWGFDGAGNALIDIEPVAGAPTPGCTFRIAGVNYPCISLGGGNVVGPNPSVVGDAPAWFNTGGSLLTGSKAVLYGAAKGMVCNAVNDDTAAFQAAITAAEAMGSPSSSNGGGTLVLPAGFCMVQGVTITKPLRIVGQGTGLGSGLGNSGGTTIRGFGAALSADLIAVASDDSVDFENLTLDFGGAYQTVGGVANGAAAISLTGATAGTGLRRSRLNRVNISGAYNGVRIVNASGWVISQSRIIDYANDGILYTASAAGPDGLGDGGDSSLDHTLLWDLNRGNSRAGFEIRGGGDINVIGSKFLASQYGVLVQASQGPTGTLLVLGNSFEEQKNTKVALTQGVAGTEYGFAGIVGNQFQSTTGLSRDIYIGTGSPTTAARWIRNVNIAGNIIDSHNNTPGSFSIELHDGDIVNVLGNNLNNNGVAGMAAFYAADSINHAQLLDNLAINFPSGVYGTVANSVAVRDSDSNDGGQTVHRRNFGVFHTFNDGTNNLQIGTSADNYGYLNSTTGTGWRLAANSINGIGLSSAGQLQLYSASLTANGAVATTLGSGPAGANAGNPVGWIKFLDNGGTQHYVPYW